MTHDDEELLGRVREAYHAPPETPREAMWQAISARLDEAPVDATAEVVDLDAYRARRGPAMRTAMWGAAAAALVVVGIGIGRMSAGGPEMAPVAEAPTVEAVDRGGALRLAAREHLGHTESLLTMVRADARGGDLDPETAVWARQLLAQTRLLIDTRTATSDPEVGDLLEDLELVLAQIVGVAELETTDRPRATTELQLALRGLEDGEVLPRIQAALPATISGE